MGMQDMGEAIENRHVGAHTRQRDWSKAMSDNIALALIVYTALQIFVTVEEMRAGMSSTVPYFALIVLVAAIIPACRWIEKRWKDLPDEVRSSEALKSDFRRDQVLLWALALGLPLAITAIFKAVFAAAA